MFFVRSHCEADMGDWWTFLDMNSYFASCEQQLRPELRGRPLGIAPVAAETTSFIAASYEAKAHGIRTGTKVRDARTPSWLHKVGPVKLYQLQL